MNWLTNLFRSRKAPPVNGAVVFLDTDLLSKEDIERIKQRMTPVFLEFSGRRLRNAQIEVRKTVTQSALRRECLIEIARLLEPETPKISLDE